MIRYKTNGVARRAWRTAGGPDVSKCLHAAATSAHWRFPQAREQIAATPRAARDLVERALEAAAPVLRPGLDRRAASLSLIGLLLVSVVWPSRGWIELSDQDWHVAATQAVNGLLR